MARRPAPVDHEKEADRLREERRIARQRNLFTFLPVTPAVGMLKEAMLQRAYDLLTEGDAGACDALLEFLPSAAVEQMLDAWLDDQDDKAEARSHWYHNYPNA